MTREERIAEAVTILKNARKTATPEHKDCIDGSLNWLDHESSRGAREESCSMGREL
ncbi:hypothetical protein [Kocuria rosea]|uniref:hypothetical protein n=1 Tax=Kocuria rosea TaxID=1275 RepID=UPI002541CD32|nr:hypothetical protein [Kocuria rosea]WIG18406.1 hypothetical protein QOY29_05610 [Kocuria rosea]